MASTGVTAKANSKQQSKQQTILKQQQQHLANQYQVPYANQCSPYAAYPLFAQPHYLSNANIAASHHHQRNHHHHHHQQQHFVGGAHTISRSKDLHKQYGHNSASAMKNQALVYYDQPYLGFNGGPLPQPAPMLAGGPYSALSLAVRAPKERGAIPTALINGAGTIGPASSRHYLAAPIDLYKTLGHPHKTSKLVYQDPLNLIDQHARLNKPLCRCRVMYLGSSVPHITKNGLHGIQEPLKHLYPEEKLSTSGSLASNRTQQQQPTGPHQSVTIDISHLSSSLGIDSWLSVWSNGLLLENVDEFGREIKRFFSIESLHYCAAVRYFDTTTLMTDNQPAPEVNGDQNNNNNNNNSIECDTTTISGQQQNDPNVSSNEDPQQQPNRQRGVVRFLPLDAPIFQYPGMLDANHPPVFAAIMRRTTGIKVLECHAFICRRDAASNALVRCCTHAYADFLSAKRMSAEFGDAAASASVNNSSHYTAGEDLQTLASNGSNRARLSNGRQNGEVQYHHVGAETRRADGHRTKLVGGGGGELNSLTTSRRDPVRSRRPARSLSTGGTNSQEMTHSDENSLEVDSEDNYAIITRQISTDWPSQQQQPNQPQQPTSSSSKSELPVAREDRRNAPDSRFTGKESSGSRRRVQAHRERKSKGSSKSLFKGFMPNEQEASLKAEIHSTSGSRNRDELDRLSHSLDHLRVSQPARCRLEAAEKCANISTGYNNSDGSDIKYSIVADKQRRHSKSMQQLAQTPDRYYRRLASETEMMNSGDSLSDETRISRSNQRRKAASCQDIPAVQQQSGNGYPQGSLSRGSSCSSRRRSRGLKRTANHSHRSSMSSLHRKSLVGSQTQLNCTTTTGEGRSRARQPAREGGGSRIYSTCDDESSSFQQPIRVLRADCYVQPASSHRAARKQQSIDSQVSSSPPSSSTTATKTAAKTKSSKRRPSDQEPLDHRQAVLNEAAAAVDPMGYYQFLQPPPPPLPLGRADCYSPLLMSPNRQSLYGLPQYTPQTLAPPYYLDQRQHHHQARQLYESPSYLLPVPGGPLFLNSAGQIDARSVSGNQQDYPHPMYHGAGSSTIAARHVLNVPLYNGAPPNMVAFNGSATLSNRTSSSHKSHTGDTKRASKVAKKSQALATRFRCLSPPLNFLTGDKSATASQLDQQSAMQSQGALAGGVSSQQTIATREEAEIDQNNNHYDESDKRQSLISTSSTTSNSISPSEIVSGQPGFLATGLGNKNDSIREAQRREARPKMSWMKRLSLTLSGGSVSSSAIRLDPTADPPNPKPLSVDHRSERFEVTNSDSDSGGFRSRQRAVEAAAAQDNANPEDNTNQTPRVAPESNNELEDSSLPDKSEVKPPQDELSNHIEHDKKQSAKVKGDRKRGGLFSGTLTFGRSSKPRNTKSK